MDNAISLAEWRYIELKGYMFIGNQSHPLPFNLKPGIICMNCKSYTYYDKCANDECYNFYQYINNTKVDGLEKEFWELVYKQHPNLREELDA